jgi:type V secretory pathway adhesin AidA
MNHLPVRAYDIGLRATKTNGRNNKWLAGDKHDSSENYQDMIDRTFKYQLSEVVASFSVELTGENNTGYNECIASVAAASALSGLSSFEQENDLIDIGLNNFYKAMLNPDNKEKVIKNIKSIRDIINKLYMNPTDVKTTDELNNLVGSLKKY